MAWSYHKRIKIIPGISLHIGKNGVSTTIDAAPADGHWNSHGASLSLESLDKFSAVPLGIQSPPTHPAPSDNIFSADVQKITRRGMQGIKEAMLMSHHQQQELNMDLETVRRTERRTRLKLQLSRILLYGILNRSFSRKLGADIASQEAVILQIREQIRHSVVMLHVEFEQASARDQYERIVEAFKRLMTSRKIWDVTSAHYQDRVAARSSADTIVRKKEVRFSLTPLPGISADVDVLHFQNANGADLYFYPGFIVMQSAPGNFALIGIDELVFSHGAVRFTETGPVPGDSTIIDHTWAKVNKNGTPDRRFKSNYQIPIVRYGELRLKTATGLHEEYECSNYEATEAFGLAFGAYQRYLRMIASGMPAR